MRNRPTQSAPAARPAWRSRLAEVQDRAVLWAQSERGKRVLTWVRRGVNVVILGAIAYQLSRIGWGDVLATMPTNPWFYVLIVVGYAALPTTESLIYGRLWGLRARQSFPALIKKRIYNHYVVDYSGEVYLYWWARRTTGRGRGEVARDVRDVNILSNAASVLVAVTLFGSLIALGWLDFGALIGEARPLYWAIGAFAAALLLALALRFRKHLFALPPRMALAVLGFHTGQVLAIYAIKLGQWTLGMPEVPLMTWLIFLAVAVLVERLPFVPSKDFVFIGAGLGLAQTLDLAEASVASMLLVATLGGQLIHLVVYSFLMWQQRRTPGGSPPMEPA